MVFDFSKLKLKDRPVLILETLSGKKLQTLGYAMNITPHLAYNEVSTLEFDIPREVDGMEVPGYDNLGSWAIIEWKDMGKFILIDPEIDYSNGYEMKHCQAYSLEFEWAFKTFVLPEGVYNFWNPVSPETTLLGMIMDTVPYWTLGTVDASLISVYRSFDEQTENLYDFVKSTVQQSVNCIFEFDTLTRTVNIRDVSSRVDLKPVYLSPKNLLKSISLAEDSQNIITAARVNGAEGVGIMTVNPTGLDIIYNLDYFMTPTHFSQEIISKWNSWKTSCENNRQYYYDVSIERDLVTARWLCDNAYMIELEEELEGLEQQQAAIAIADNPSDYKNSQLATVNAQISQTKSEIQAQQQKLNDAEDEIADLTSQLENINKSLDLNEVFSDDEWLQVQKYIKEDSIEETTFVYPTVKSYNTSDESYNLSNQVCVIGPPDNMPPDSPGIVVTKVNQEWLPDKDVYSIDGGYLKVENVSANIVKGAFERNADGSFVTSFYLGRGSVGDRNFQSGCVAISGSCSSPIDNTTPDPDVPDALATGTTLQFTISSGYIYITENLTTYQEHSVEWDLLEWGEDTLSKLASPTYTFDIDSANFLSLDDFDFFRKNLELGTKCILEIQPGTVIQPILIGVECEYSDLSKLTLEFSNSYVSSDPSFQIKDLLEQAVSMGHRVDYSKYTYSSFVDSGASTAVDTFINSALDTAKNAIMTSGEQAITWDSNGLRFRKWNEDHSDYEDEQIWAINNQIVFSDDGFNSVKTAIGRVQVGNSWMYGIVAEALIGRLIAGQTLVIESSKTDNLGQSVFKVDGEGVQIHDAVLDVYNGSNTHLSINPYFGIAIGKYPVFSDSGNEGYQVNEDNAVFWVDLDGNLHIKGQLEVGSGGTFGGVVRATDFQDKNGNSMLVNRDDDYRFDATYLDLRGITVRNSNNEITFQVTGDGHVSISGNVVMLGGSISWETIGEPPSIDEVRGTANSAQSAANAAQSKADSAYNRADSAYSEATAAGNTASSTSAAITDLVNGRYDPDHDYAYSTFIQGNAIYSPELYFGENSNYGYLKVGTGSNGEEVTDLIVLHGDNGLRIEAQGGGLAIVASGGVWSGEGAVEGDDTIWHFGDVYALATHTDTISGRPGTGNNLHLSGTVYLDSYSSTRPLVEYEWLWRDRTNALKQALDSAGISVPQWPG